MRKILLFFFSLLLILPAVWPLFRADFFRMHDFTHVARLIELNVALRDGQIPPRWAPDFGWGYGMPLFHFYPPLAYYVAEFFYLIGFSAVEAIKIVFGLNFLLGFWFMYLWAGHFWGRIGGLVSAAAFTYLPYRAVQFYVRGTLAELTAMTILPIFFYAGERMVTTKKWRYLAMCATAMACLFLAHNVIALLAVFFFCLYFIFNILFQIKKKRGRIIFPWGRILLIILSVILSLGLSAFFIFPAYFEKDYTIVSSIAGGYSHYSLHFIYLRQLFDRRWAYGGSVAGPFDDISFQIGLPHIFLVVFSFFVLINLLRTRRKETLTVLIYCLVATAISVFMMTYHSKTVWDRLEFLHIAQFPWRFLNYLGVFVAFLSGSLWLILQNQRIAVLLAMLTIIITVGLNVGYFKPKEFSNPEEFYYTGRKKIQNLMSDVLFDYLPKSALKNPPLFNQVVEFEGMLEMKEMKTGLFRFITKAEQDENFALNTYYFPGWQAFIDDQPVFINSENAVGRVEFAVPAGEHNILVKLAKTKLQLWSDYGSLLSWTLLLFFTGVNLKKKWS